MVETRLVPPYSWGIQVDKWSTEVVLATRVRQFVGNTRVTESARNYQIYLRIVIVLVS